MKKLAQYDGADNLPALGTVDLIEALREVAWAAKHFAARGYEHPQYEWRTAVIGALDALPEWVLEEN